MDDAAAEVVKKSSAVEKDLERISRLSERLERALREAAETEMELSRVDGTIRGFPHDSAIEGRAHELGKQLSWTVQQRQINELAAGQKATAKCPKCDVRCLVDTTRRWSAWAPKRKVEFDRLTLVNGNAPRDVPLRVVQRLMDESR